MCIRDRCENAPQEWQNVPAETIRRFQKSVRYKRADNKEAALEKFKLTFQKQDVYKRQAETSAEGKSIYMHCPKGEVAEAYMNLTQEVLKNEK